MRCGLVLLGIVSLVCLGCSKEANKVVIPRPKAKILSAAPEIDSGNEEGFSDCVFYFDKVKTARNVMTFNAQGLAKGKKVGFTIQYLENWDSKSVNPNDVNLSVEVGSVMFTRSGPESDAFVAALAKYYAKTSPGKRMVDNVRFNAICLKGDPSNLSNGPISIKMFVDSEVEAKYGEFFLDIDVNSHSIRLGEKDPDYRLPILKALTNQSK